MGSASPTSYSSKPVFLVVKKKCNKTVHCITFRDTYLKVYEYIKSALLTLFLACLAPTHFLNIQRQHWLPLLESHYYCRRRQWKPTPLLLPGKSHGRRSLVGYSPWVTKSRTWLSDFTFTHWRRKWQPTPLFLPGESRGRGSLVSRCLWGCTESDATDATWRQQRYYCLLAVWLSPITYPLSVSFSSFV